MQPLRGAAGLAATFVDYDNDGWLDLLVGTGARDAGHAERVSLPERRHGEIPRPLDADPERRARERGVRHRGHRTSTTMATRISLLLDAAGAPRLLRNDNGNSNLAVNVELKGLGTGSGKNNAFGIGARLELRAGEIYQTRVATGRTTHFGLGPHLKADVLRIEWPNGVPQTVYFPGSDQDVVEREVLKGSCAFAYTWDGKRFRFVTDAMWRSALGMPLGLMGGARARSPRRARRRNTCAFRATRSSRATDAMSCSSPRSCGRRRTPTRSSCSPSTIRIRWTCSWTSASSRPDR